MVLLFKSLHVQVFILFVKQSEWLKCLSVHTCSIECNLDRLLTEKKMKSFLLIIQN